jgi:hypothetical protein
MSAERISWAVETTFPARRPVSRALLSLAYLRLIKIHGGACEPGILAVQHIRKLRGGSQSHLLRASDGANWSRSWIRRIASKIPSDWYEFDTDGLNRLVETLYRRRAITRDLIVEFRTSSLNPFPNWTAN